MAPLRDLRRHLLGLHRALVNVERADYERAARRLSDGEFLDALIKDPAFAWLSALTTLIVRLDELLEEEPATGPDDCVAQIRELLKPDPLGSEFQRMYSHALQRSPEVVVAHGNVIRALQT